MRRTIREILTVSIAVFALTSTLEARTDGWEDLFFRANQAYREGRFHDAVEGYNKLIRDGHGNGHINYNLGNAHFRLNHPGRAILNYERARITMPRDADLNFNLTCVRDQIKDAIAEPRDFIGITFFWLDSLSIAELFLGFTILNVFFWGILIARLFIKKEWSYYLVLILLVFWIMAGASFGLKLYQSYTDDRAVILNPEVNILAGPDTGDTVLFKLHEGTIVHQERTEEGWSLVRLPDKKRGWIKNEGLERIKTSSVSLMTG